MAGLDLSAGEIKSRQTCETPFSLRALIRRAALLLAEPSRFGGVDQGPKRALRTEQMITVSYWLTGDTV